MELSGGNVTSALGTNFSINSLNFSSVEGASNSVTIGGNNTLTIGAGGLIDNSLGTNVLSTNVVVSTQTWTNNTTSPLTTSGIVSGTGNWTFQGTGAITRVLLDASDGDQVWGSIGVSENVIEASWEALVDSLEFGMRVAGRRARGEAASTQRS